MGSASHSDITNLLFSISNSQKSCPLYRSIDQFIVGKMFSANYLKFYLPMVWEENDTRIQEGGRESFFSEWTHLKTKWRWELRTYLRYSAQYCYRYYYSWVRREQERGTGEHWVSGTLWPRNKTSWNLSLSCGCFVDWIIIIIEFGRSSITDRGRWRGVN